MAISRPSTSADKVAIRPITSFTVSFDSSSRWCAGTILRSIKPMRPAVKQHTKTIEAMMRSLIGATSPVARSRFGGHLPQHLKVLHHVSRLRPHGRQPHSILEAALGRFIFSE